MREWKIVPTRNVLIMWPIVAEMVTQACISGHEKYLPQDMLKLVIEEKAQLWIGSQGGRIEGAAFTDIISYPNKRYARLTMGGGDDPLQTQSLIKALESWAQEIGCSGIQCEMRPGFSPCFKKEGWIKTHVLMEKDLRNA